MTALSRTWVGPTGYPTRCTPDLADRIAEAILLGATPNAAAMAERVAPSRLRDWMRWGEEAYRRDADDSDYHAPYLDLFLKVMVACGQASMAIQQRLYRDTPGWWLTHHPEARVEWGGEPGGALLLTSPDVLEAAEVADASVGEDDRLTDEQLAELVADMAKHGALPLPSGGAVSEDPDEIVVDADPDTIVEGEIAS